MAKNRFGSLTWTIPKRLEPYRRGALGKQIPESCGFPCPPPELPSSQAEGQELCEVHLQNSQPARGFCRGIRVDCLTRFQGVGWSCVPGSSQNTRKRLHWKPFHPPSIAGLKVTSFLVGHVDLYGLGIIAAHIPTTGAEGSWPGLSPGCPHGCDNPGESIRALLGTQELTGSARACCWSRHCPHPGSCG